MGARAETQKRLQKASPDDMESANRRYRAIEPYLRGQAPENDIVSQRTIRDWKAKYRAAEQRYGCGYIGLLSHSCAKGNRNRKLPSDTLALMDKFITEDYCTLKQKKMWEVYCALVRACEHNAVIVPSYKTFTRTVKQRSGYEQTRASQRSSSGLPTGTFLLGVRQNHAASRRPSV